ncbi:phosphotransferase family protein [Natronosporangium hydrolyticum]|uniref:phosphotransferase family protein n=1 Tax=Natronosporangium hydrolyticum TaxID=2811111 RepID=UPI001EFA268A|nr:aminoglycoside phosphotransferase family protein [Natronosporangium hydrolyticum]
MSGAAAGGEAEPISPTQRRLTSADLHRLAVASFGAGTRVRECQPLPGGGFAAVWSVTLDDGRAGPGREMVLKTAPPATVPLLSYERGLLAAEARYYRTAAQAATVPLPLVHHHGADPAVLDGEWLFTERLPGRPLPDWTAAPEAGAAPVDDHPVRHALGEAVASLHRVTGPTFGYDGGRVAAPTWRGAFTAIIDELLDDAGAWRVTLPATAPEIRALVRRHAALLDLVARPALLHYDLWDGNVLASPGDDGQLRLRGLVDGERYLYGDPLVDFVSVALFRRIEDEPDHPFVQGYAAVHGPVSFDRSVRRRLMLYRLHLYLLMVAEMPSRGMVGDRWRRRREFLIEQLRQQLAGLTA